ncbi:hypothetical protein BDN72DRAFT_893804 [Pluteus cervinus]|uniref:Uncharacterized protein n=1 Tax=Pluteus cervinus TaxID=181527 RepID=A0ACD3B7G1_9AGAR|nr:hypothetical protein BDN72DRAFT_893804 [Pluteus cervinus]
MASSSPVIFKRSKARGTQRARPASPDEKEVAAQEDETPSAFAAKLKNKSKKSKIKSKLTFGGEEEEDSSDVPQVKKLKSLSLGASLNLDQATISASSGPRYDQAYLNELKASTLSVRPTLPDDADMMVMSIDSNDSPMIIDTVQETEDASTYIPSESSIKSAREKRRRIQTTGVTIEEEYISLSVVRKSDQPQGPHPDSRLVREEDELGEGDDEFAEYTSAQERIALGKKSRKVEAQKRRDGMQELIDEAVEEDDETIEWEQEQLRRGGHRTPDTSKSTTKAIYRPAPIPASVPVPSTGTVMARLTQQLSQLTTSHAKNTAALNSVAQQRNEVEDREKEMREMVGKAEEKRAWFDNFREWVEAVAGFLDEKYPLLEKLEEEQLFFLKERFDMVAKRRREDDGDDLATFWGPLPEITAPEDVRDEVDELGRTVPKLSPVARKIKRRADRLARRQRRRERQLRAVDDEEGYSTDGSLPPDDASAYAQAMRSLGSKTKEVLSDVKAEEFKDPGKGKWGTWRTKYTDSYVGAWGGLGVVSVWEFWTRLELVGWNCIEDSRSLDGFKWYQGLYEYSRPGEGDVVERNLGPDGDLVASMISTAVIPWMCRVIEGGALDVYSQGHIRRVIDLADEVGASIEGENAKFQALIKSVFSVFQNAVAETEKLVAQYRDIDRRVPFNPEAIPARQRFVARRIKLLRNLIRWRKYAGERFGLGRLVDRILVEGSTIEILHEGWDIGGMAMAHMISTSMADSIPPGLVQQLLTRHP